MKKQIKIERLAKRLVKDCEMHARSIAKLTNDYEDDLPEIIIDTLEIGACHAIVHAKSLFNLIKTNIRDESTIKESRITRAQINMHRDYVFWFTESFGRNPLLLDVMEETATEAFDRADSIVAAMR